MKKVYLLLIVFLFGVSNLDAQPLKFKTGIVNGPTTNSMDIVVQPNVAFTGYFTNVIFILQIPVGTVQPTITKTSLSPYFVFSADLPTLPNEAGYVTYGYASVNASVTANVTLNAGELYPILRLTFLDGSLTPQDIRLSHLATGGPGTLYQNYVEANAVGPGANDYTNYVQMFFGGNIEPIAPHPTEQVGYDSYQWVQRAQVLPVNWLSFSAIRHGNNGLLNWAVANEDDNHHYELQRSTNGTDFTSIATVNKSANAGGVYNYTDVGITGFSSSIVYYRVKQVEVSGNFSYSDIKHITIDKKGPEITIFPNPVWKGFYVNVPLTGAGTEKLKLNLFGTNGQIIASKEITAAQATNYYFDITDMKLAAGQYNLQIIMNEKSIASKMLTIKQ